MEDKRELRRRQTLSDPEHCARAQHKIESSRSRRLHMILKKATDSRSEEEQKLLIQHSDLVREVEQKIVKNELIKARLEEIEDDHQVLLDKVDELVRLIQKSAGKVVVYTGAGISTSAQIPDYRGPNGVWTRMKIVGKMDTQTKDIALAKPTFTHQAIKTLHDHAIIQHVVSQNCDGLHFRSGLPQNCLSEIHGNMFIELCPNCEHQYFRNFDVTEQTSFRRHRTGRQCVRGCAISADCKSDHEEEKNKKKNKKMRKEQEEEEEEEEEDIGPDINLVDTIIHFGEKSHFTWPQNWPGAIQALAQCDLIICLGSSLKVLKEYKCLWPSRNANVALVIVNLQWTSKDRVARLKINAKCDDVMRLVMNQLNLQVPDYQPERDQLKSCYEPLCSGQSVSCHRVRLFEQEDDHDDDDDDDNNAESGEMEEEGKNIKSKTMVSSGLSHDEMNCNQITPGWFGKGIKAKKYH